ncbi:TUT7 [Symbiodinium microadriaticum]|nr:TUT7 [Symbiodinium microadriaticum]
MLSSAHAGRRNAQLQVSCLEQEARARLNEYAMTTEVRERMNRCVHALEEVVTSLGPNWRVSPFGSAANGFGTKFSDLDATCYELPEEGKEPEQQQPAAEVLSERLAPLLRKHKSFDIAQEVLHARVPILKLCFEGKLEVDLSCHNTLPLQNTKLLKAYSTLDDRVKELVILVKLWAKDRGVCGASRSHLSSYALTLMAIYFMQVHPKISLPMLPPQAFKDDSHVDVGAKVEAARSSWSCNLSLGQFVLRFFNFYSLEFSWGSEVVSVRLPNRLDASENHLVKLKGRNFRRLHVEDPVDETRNLNCVLGDAQEIELQRALAETYSRLQAKEPVSLGTPLEETQYAGADLASSPGRTVTIKVFEHLLQSCPEEADLPPAIMEAAHRHEAENLINIRQHSLSEASTAASCASSTDEEHGAAQGEGENSPRNTHFRRGNGKEKLRRGSGAEGSPDGYVVAEAARTSPILQMLQQKPDPEITPEFTGQMAGLQLLQMIRHEQPTAEPEHGPIPAQPPAQRATRRTKMTNSIMAKAL